MSAHFVSFYFVCAFILTASGEVRILEIYFAHCFILTPYLLGYAKSSAHAIVEEKKMNVE